MCYKFRVTETQKKCAKNNNATMFCLYFIS